jgi:parallel beta-helix repeat protein
VTSRWALAGLLSALALAGCGSDDDGGGDDAADSGGADDDGSTGTQQMLPDGCDHFVEPSDDDQTALQEAFIEAEAGDTVCLSAGTFSFSRELTLSQDGVTLTGEARDTTILDFTDQISGGNGILISGNDVTMTKLTVKNTPGDGVRADQVDNIAFVDMTVGWDAQTSLENGAYGLYPVQATGVRIQGTTVYGARDAGVYVGQSSDIVVEDSEAYGNVAGIEIENSTDAQVRRNSAHDNTAGVLVFNLPGLEIKDGKRANVYENTLENNNVPNFGESGTVVAMVPHGLGAIILAADDNEFGNNTVTGNDSAGIVIIQYTDDLFPPPNDPEFDIYAEGNWIHDNTFSGNGSNPHDLLLLVTGNAMPSPDIIFDGCSDDAKTDDGTLANCVSGNGEATWMAVDLCNQLPDGPDTDIANATCEYTPLPRD